MISYRPLMVTLAKKGLKKADLLEMANISGPTLAKFAKNEYVKLEILDRICRCLNCDFNDVVTYVPEDQ